MSVKSDLIIRQANDIVRAPADTLAPLESKLLFYSIAQIAAANDGTRTFSCTTKEFAQISGEKPANVYRVMQETAIGLMHRAIYVPEQKSPSAKPCRNYQIISWTSNVSYKDGIFSIKLSEEIEPLVVNLKNCFTSCSFAELRNLSSYYSIRLFWLLLSYRGIDNSIVNLPNGNTLDENECAFSVAQIREFFQLDPNRQMKIKEPAKYPNFYDVKKRILEPSILDISKNTSFNASCRYVKCKQGGSIDYVVFRLDSKQIPSVQLPEQSKKKKESLNSALSEIFPSFSDYQRRTIKNAIESVPERFLPYAENLDTQRIQLLSMMQDKMQTAMDNGSSIAHPAAYLRKMVNNYVASALAEESMPATMGNNTCNDLNSRRNAQYQRHGEISPLGLEAIQRLLKEMDEDGIA